MPASSATRTASLRFGPQRVDDPDQRDEDQVGDRAPSGSVDRGRHRGVVEVARPRTPGPAGPAPTASGWRRGARRGRRRSAPARRARARELQRSMTTSGAPLTVMKCGALQDAAAEPVGTVVERRHELVLGVERHLGPSRERRRGSPRPRRPSSPRAPRTPLRSGSPMTDPSSPTVASQESTRPRARREKSGTGPPATPRMAPVLA